MDRHRGPRLHCIQGRLTPLGLSTLRALVRVIAQERKGRYGMVDYVSDAVKRCMRVDCESRGIECRIFSSGMENTLQPVSTFEDS